jgi:hypothetical protein
MNKEEYVANMRAMVKKYVERAEDSVTNPPTKRVEMPRAKIGDIILLCNRDSQMTVRGAMLIDTEWRYRCDYVNNEGEEVRIVCSNSLICANLSTNIDYQETESKQTCLHRWKIIGQLPNLTGEECELCGRIIGIR